MTLTIDNRCASFRAPRKRIEEVLADAFAHYGEGAATACLQIVSDDAMVEMNRSFKKRDETTDVLAFEDGDPDPDTGVVHLGDIVISADTAARVAGERGLPVTHEIVLYALHGLLHLLGFRDHDEASAARMVAAQKEIFERHGMAFDM